jgi:hypothetical protein
LYLLHHTYYLIYHYLIISGPHNSEMLTCPLFNSHVNKIQCAIYGIVDDSLANAFLYRTELNKNYALEITLVSFSTESMYNQITFMFDTL